VLTSFVEAHEGVIGAVFLDQDGECIDYATSREPYEVMVLGATLLLATQQLVRSAGVLGSGAPVLWLLEAERFDAAVRRVTDEHLVAVWLETEQATAEVRSALGPLADALRRESGLPTPEWDPMGEPLDVEVRHAVGWGYAPARVRMAPSILDVEVLGRWTEHASLSAQQAVCFRVRMAGQELTLVHEPALNRWCRR
jgi:hypothetical protein